MKLYSYGSYDGHSDLLLWNSKHVSDSYFRYSRWWGPFSGLTPSPLAALASRQLMTSGHIIAQEYKNTHQSFGAPSSFDPAEESSPFLLNSLLAKPNYYCTASGAEYKIALYGNLRPGKQKGVEQQPIMETLIRWVHTLRMMVSKENLQVLAEQQMLIIYLIQICLSLLRLRHFSFYTYAGVQRAHTLKP